MGEALYRKYRPQTLLDVVGQPHITNTLTKAIQSGRISHGYLFAGPRGVGKTSVARILAYQLNGVQYGDKNIALDIIEIDAASNRRIDEIRELRDKINIAPVNGRYKIYIIDEVHMLTREAFNALLKTLEEPPAHVIFILATTEIHKVPETIISRTQRYYFKSIHKTEIMKHLKELAKKEGINIDNSAVELIAEHGSGSFRDSIGLLDQMSGLKKITLKNVEQLLGIPSNTVPQTIIEELLNGQAAQLMRIIENQYSAGINATQLSNLLVRTIKQGVVENKYPLELLELSKELLLIPASSDPNQLLEICLLDWALRQTSNQSKIGQKLKNTTKNLEAKSKVAKINVINEKNSADNKQDNDIPHHKLDGTVWSEIVNKIKHINNTLYGVIRTADPIINDNTVTLRVGFAFHKKLLTQQRNSRIISDILRSKNLSAVYNVELLMPIRQINKDIASQSDTTNTLDSVKAIFGGGEVLGS